MPRNQGGTYSLPAGSTATDGTTAEATTHNTPLSDLESDANVVRPIVAGGTGGASASAARTELDVPGLGEDNAFTGENTFASSGATVADFARSGAAGNNRTIVTFDRDGTQVGQIAGIDGTSIEIRAESSHELRFGAGGTADQMRLNPSGDFHIGGTSTTLDDAGIRLNANGSADFVRNAAAALRASRTGSVGNIAEWYEGAGNFRGAVAGDGAGGVNYGSASDHRLKDLIEDLTGSGDFIDRLRPRRWRWKNSGMVGAGFVAHEMQEVAPGCVTGKKDGPVMQSLDAGTPEIIANLVAEIQRLRQRVETLEMRS